MKSASQLVDEFLEYVKETSKETRLEYIKRIFDHDKELGCDKVELKRNKYYYNDLFDGLYNLSMKDLESMDKKMSLIVKQYNEDKNCIEHE